jgi:hypothetical protein
MGEGKGQEGGGSYEYELRLTDFHYQIVLPDQLIPPRNGRGLEI